MLHIYENILRLFSLLVLIFRNKMLFLLFICLSTIFQVKCANQPNILLIVADDMGYNDVGYRGNNQVKTPNIDALAYHGSILNKFYTLPICTPSRAALITGNYPIRFGFQGRPILSGEERHIPSNIPTLPEQLKKLGYKTHLVGKWHLGHAWRNVTPIGRGFDTHYGYYNGMTSYFDHYDGYPTGMYGLDFRDDFKPNWKDSGLYATDLFTNRSIKIINEHNYDKPLFLMISHLAPHTGRFITSDFSVVEVKDNETMNENFGYIKDVNRRRYVDVVKSLDDSIGEVIKALSERKVLDNTYIFFISDNGGPLLTGKWSNYASNWPLRGVKSSHFEGGIKVTAIFYTKNMTNKHSINNNLMHISDLLPTFYAAGGGDVKNLGKLDGVNQLSTLLTNQKTQRSELLVNIEDLANSSAIITHNGRYKLISGLQHDGMFDVYTGVSGRLEEDGFYDVKSVLKSQVNMVLNEDVLNSGDVLDLRLKSMIKNCRGFSYEKKCELCLFDLDFDPCERFNLADFDKNLVKELLEKIDGFRGEMVKQQTKDADLGANPSNFGGVWSYWLDSNPI